jgi:hypothetical protein
MGNRMRAPDRFSGFFELSLTIQGIFSGTGTGKGTGTFIGASCSARGSRALDLDEPLTRLAT